MKVKNIVFSGFAAAILMGVAADANADTHVVTKGYIDSLDSTVSIDQGAYASGVTQTNGKVTGLTARPFDQTISENSTHDNAPTSKAVYTAIQGANDGLDVPEVGSAGSYIQKVVQNDGAVTATPTTFDTTISDQSTNNNAPTSLAVYTAIQGANADLDLEEVGAAGSYIQKVSQSEGQVAATMTGFDTAITETSGHNNAPTSKAVYDYVTQLTGGVLPTTDCTSGNCALVKLNGTVQWVDLTTPL